MVGDQPSTRMGAGAVVADPLPDGSGVDRRLIPEEPMSIVLNLAISCESMELPSLYCRLTTIFLVSLFPNRGSEHDDVPVRNAYRLYPGIPTEGTHEHWVRSPRLPYGGLHRPALERIYK